MPSGNFSRQLFEKKGVGVQQLRGQVGDQVLSEVKVGEVDQGAEKGGKGGKTGESRKKSGTRECEQGNLATYTLKTQHVSILS